MSFFTFEEPGYFYLLTIIPILALLFIAARIFRRRVLNRFGDPALVSRLMPGASRYKHTLKFVLLMVAVAFLITGIANPQFGTKMRKIDPKGIDLIIALDVSQSMLAQDVSPSRLERAKRFAQNVVKERAGDKVGLIVFACNAFLQAPLTDDYNFINLTLSTANPGMVPSQGTAIADAIDLAERSFEPDSKMHKALIIISDGEDHDGEAVDRAKQARANGLIISTVGVGAPEGSFIPTYVAGRQDYMRDRSGNPIRSQLNETILEEVAGAGDGNYFNLAAGSEQVIAALHERIDAIEKREFEARVFDEYESYFYYPIGIALVLLLIEFMISYRQNRYLAKRDIFEV